MTLFPKYLRHPLSITSEYLTVFNLFILTPLKVRNSHHPHLQILHHVGSFAEHVKTSFVITIASHSRDLNYSNSYPDWIDLAPYTASAE